MRNTSQNHSIEKHQILKQLAAFRHITPRDAFSQQSKRLILSSPRTSQQDFTHAQYVSFGSHMHSIALRTVRVGAFVSVGIVLLITVLYATQELSPVLLPGLNQQRITAEADMINSSISIELSRIGYFEHTAQESISVLQQMSQKNMDHLNTSVITREVEMLALPTSDTTSTELNDLIKKVTE